MTNIDNIMALADEYAAASIETALAYTGDLMDFVDAENAKKHALRAAIEAALKMEHLNYLGCMEDLKEAEKTQPKQKPLAWLPNDAIDQLEAPRLVLTNVPLVTYAAENHTAIYTAPQPHHKQEQSEALRVALDWYDNGNEDREEFEEMIKNLLTAPQPQREWAEK
jgi:hypothetical protein